MGIFQSIKTNIQLRHEISRLKFQISQLEEVINKLMTERKVDFQKLQSIFENALDQKENEVRNIMQALIDKKHSENERLTKMIEEQHDVVQGVKNRNVEMIFLEDESVQRMKLASDFFNKGIQQLERIFSEFSVHRKRFKNFELKEIPKLKHSSEV